MVYRPYRFLLPNSSHLISPPRDHPLSVSAMLFLLQFLECPSLQLSKDIRICCSFYLECLFPPFSSFRVQFKFITHSERHFPGQSLLHSVFFAFQNNFGLFCDKHFIFKWFIFIQSMQNNTQLSLIIFIHVPLMFTY